MRAYPALLAVIMLAGCTSAPQSPTLHLEAHKRLGYTAVNTIQLDATPPVAGYYGDARDGDVQYGDQTQSGAMRAGVDTQVATQSEPVFVDGIVQAHNITIPADVTLTTHGHDVILYAQDTIQVDGTITVRGLGGHGGVQGPGEDGLGLAGQPGNENGGGGSGIPQRSVQVAFMRGTLPDAPWGAGGGGATCTLGQVSHGAGGAGGLWSEGERGLTSNATVVDANATPGQGGNGGGRVLLAAPHIIVTGTIDAGGEDGTYGTGCGDGGAGAGGLIELDGQANVTGTILVDGGQFPVAGATGILRMVPA